MVSAKGSCILSIFTRQPRAFSLNSVEQSNQGTADRLKIGPRSLAGTNHQVQWGLEFCLMQAESFPNQTLPTIADNRITNTTGNTDPQSAARLQAAGRLDHERFIGSKQVALVHPRKLTGLAQPRCLGIAK